MIGPLTQRRRRILFERLEVRNVNEGGLASVLDVRGGSRGARHAGRIVLTQEKSFNAGDIDQFRKRLAGDDRHLVCCCDTKSRKDLVADVMTGVEAEV